MNLYDIVAPMSVKEAQETAKTHKQKQSMPAGHKPGWALDPKTKLELTRRQKVQNRVGVDENAWNDGTNDWTSEHDQWAKESADPVIALTGVDEDSNDFMANDSASPVGGKVNEGASFRNGDQVELKPEYAERPGEVFTVSQCDVERNRCWIGDEQDRGWYVTFDQIMPASEKVDEHIVKVKGGYELKSKHGNKNLGKYPTRAGAEKRERQVQYFKHAGESVEEGFFGDMKQSFATGMVDKLKKSIPAEHHKHYDFDSVKSPSDTKAMVARARAAGHLKESGMAEGSLRSQIGDIELLDYYITDDTGCIVAGPFDTRWAGHEAYEKMLYKRQDIHFWQGRALIVKLAGMNEEQGVAEAGPNAPYTPSPAKPFRNPPGFNKQGTGVGNKLAHFNRKEWEEKKKKEQGVAESTGDLRTELARVYRAMAPGIERHRDSHKAGELYDALEAVADARGAGKELDRMMRGARNSAHMEYDTNPGGFENWFWFLPFATDEQGIDEVKQRLDAKCWAGKHKEGTKIKGGVRVNNCVPNEGVAESYWTKLQNEKNSKLNSLVTELAESVKKIK